MSRRAHTVLAPWHIRSEKSLDFANRCVKEPAQGTFLHLLATRSHLVAQFVGTDVPSGMLLRSSEEDESLGKSDSQIEELSWTYEGSSQYRFGTGKGRKALPIVTVYSDQTKRCKRSKVDGHCCPLIQFSPSLLASPVTQGLVAQPCAGGD